MGGARKIRRGKGCFDNVLFSHQRAALTSLENQLDPRRSNWTPCLQLLLEGVSVGRGSVTNISKETFSQ